MRKKDSTEKTDIQTQAGGVQTKKHSGKNWNLILGSILTGTVCLFVLIGLFAVPYDPEAMDASLKLAGASAAHPFGCDQFGRDILSRVMKGSGVTLLIALATVVVGAFFGILLGAFTGYSGGLVDEVLMRINDVLFAFPSILLALVFISLLGPGGGNVVIALGIAFIPSFARIVRSEFIRCKNMDYVRLARLAGAGQLRIMFVHILPNTIGVLLPACMIGFNNAVLAEAGMSYLGIGVQPPDPSLGRMLSEAQTYLFSAPGLALFPGLLLVLMVLGASLLADGLKQRNR